MFLASCRDFHDTPFAAKGKPCPLPLWGCLECQNAVFTTRHLPQPLTFLDFIEGQREELAAAEWLLRYGTAMFYLETASVDLLVARREVAELEAVRDRAVGRYRGGQARARVQEFIERRRLQGHGIPARPLQGFLMDSRVGLEIVDGVVQAPNIRLSSLMAGVSTVNHLAGMLERAGAEVGFEEARLDTPISVWPGTGRPWRRGWSWCPCTRRRSSTCAPHAGWSWPTCRGCATVS